MALGLVAIVKGSLNWVKRTIRSSTHRMPLGETYVTHWLGGIAMAVGLPCWVQGILMDLHIAAMLTELNVSTAPSESIQRTTEWVQDTYWFGPYLLWLGGALTVAGCGFGIVGLIWGNSDDNVLTSDRDYRT